MLNGVVAEGDSSMKTSRMILMKTVLMIVTGLTMILMNACTKQYTDYSAFICEPKPMVSTSTYTLEPPDLITITSKRVREINGHSETIRPDGRITLPLLGSIYIAGMTPEQASAHLATLAQEYYEDADVSLRVTSYRSKKIFVFGEVSLPGAIPYDGTNTVLKTMAICQPTRLSDPSKIQILRPSPDGELRKRMTIDLDRIVQEGDTTLDAMLQDGDIIYVPPNPFAAVGLALQQVLLPVQPIVQTIKAPADIQDAAFDKRSYGEGYRDNAE